MTTNDQFPCPRPVSPPISFATRFPRTGSPRSRRKRGLSRPNWKARAQVWTWASKMRSPVHHDQNEVGALVERRPDGSGIAGAEDRLGQDERDTATVLVDELAGERQELDRRVGVRAAAATARAAASGRRRHLRQEGWVADHEVEPLATEVVAERVGAFDARSRQVRPGGVDRLPDRCRRPTTAHVHAVLRRPLGRPRRGTVRHRTPGRAPAAAVARGPAAGEEVGRSRRGRRSWRRVPRACTRRRAACGSPPTGRLPSPSGCDGMTSDHREARLRPPAVSPGEPTQTASKVARRD